MAFKGINLQTGWGSPLKNSQVLYQMVLLVGCGAAEPVPVVEEWVEPVIEAPSLQADFRLRAGHLEIRKIDFSDEDAGSSKAFYDANWRLWEKCYADALAKGDFCGQMDVRFDVGNDAVSRSVLVDTVDAPAESDFDRCLGEAMERPAALDRPVTVNLSVVFAPTEADFDRCAAPKAP